MSIHVDQYHPEPISEDGTVFRPYDSVAEAVADLGGSKDAIAILKGTYDEGSLVVTDSCVVKAPIGTVVIR